MEGAGHPGGCPFSTDRNGVEKEYMTLLMRDRENRKIGEKLGKIHEAISMEKDYNIPESEILIRLQTKIDLTEEQARAYMEEAE